MQKEIEILYKDPMVIQDKFMQSYNNLLLIIMFSGIPFYNKSEITLSYLFRNIDNMIHVYTTNL